MKDIKESAIPSEPVIQADPELDKVEFETEGDKLRMDVEVAKKKGQFERVPRFGSGEDLEHHRRVTAQRRRFLGSVGEEQGWQALPKGLIEDAKALLSASKVVEKPKVAAPFTGKVHPHVQVNGDKKMKTSKNGDKDGK